MTPFARRIVFVAVALVLALSSLCARAATLAGTSIDNRASVTYRDTTTGVVSQLDSNVVSAVLDVVEALQLSANQSFVRPPGTSFTALHRLTNTGNAVASYAISVAPVAGSAFSLQTLIAYWDVNGNGSTDPGEPVVSAGFSVQLQPGQSTQFVIYGVVPANTVSGQSTSVQITGTSSIQGVKASNVDTISVGDAAPALQLTKSASTTTPTQGGQVTFSLSAVNNGTADAAGTSVVVNNLTQTMAVIRDQIPPNTRLLGISGGNLQPLYHLAGNPLHAYVSTAPVDLSTVDAVAFGVPQVAVGQVLQGSFTVGIAANASGTIVNTGLLYARNGSTELQVPSNDVQLTLPALSPSLAFYVDNTFGRTVSVGVVGAPLFLQANAAQCNLDPLKAEVHDVILNSALSHDREVFSAIETGPNTGIFRVLPNVPTRDSQANPVMPGNGILELQRGDVITATLQGCGTASVQATMLIDPGGLVFDSRTNAPIASAAVTLIDVTGGGNGGHPGQPAVVYAVDAVTAAANPVTTGVDGRFEFPLVQPSTYKVLVVPPSGYTFPSTLPTQQLPVGHNLDNNGSYAREFVVASSNAPVRFDIPVDRNVVGTTMVEKTASRATAEIGDFVDYTVLVKNQAGIALSRLKVNDALPRGFSYQTGSTRINGAVAPDPAGNHGPALVFTIDSVPANGQITLQYRVRIGMEASLGDSLNHAFATDGETNSNVAVAKVTVMGGAFSTQGYVIGKVFEDCNGNGRQDAGESGIPGVRVLLEDQTYAITDGEGKYSLYGITARTHVLKLDPLSLPAGFHAIPLSHRNAGDGETLFVDMKNGEMMKADFATSCSDEVKKAVDRRRAAQRPQRGEAEAALGVNFTFDTIHRSIDEVKGTAAAGIAGAASGVPSSNVTANAAPSTAPGPTSAATGKPGDMSPVATNAASSKPGVPTKLEEAVATLSNEVGFVGLEDGQILPFAQATIRVKGPAESVFTLAVNGELVKQNRISRKVSLPDLKLEAWEFVGVELKPGHNLLRLTQFDQFGNERGRKEITVIAPKALKQLRLKIPADAVADGKTPVKIGVQLLDEDGVPVTFQTRITLESSEGQWQVHDLDPSEPGVQTFVEGGYAEFLLTPPATPVIGKLRVSDGPLRTESTISFAPALRPLIAVGAVEQIINFRSLGARPPATASFEDYLQRLTVNAGSITSLQSHAGFSMKGDVKGYLLTLAYDSDKQARDPLFRDIQPDQYYPVYGDSSVRGFDAQSTSQAYVRVDKGNNYLQYGDFTTQDANPARFLSVYTRSATGVKQHWQNQFASVTTFATRDSLQQQVEEIPANGTSGPYLLKYANGLVNSETVEVLVRDRNQPALVLSVTPQSRFSDYEFEPNSGEIIFKSAVPSFDQNLNPVSIRVSYELDQGGQKFWLAGVDTNFKLNRKVQAGTLYIADMNPMDEFHLMGFNSTVKVDEHTSLTAEFAQTSKQSVGDGTGYRVELLHDSAKLKVRTYLGRTTTLFDNPNALLNQGRGEGGLKLSWKMSDKLRLVADAIRTEDASTGGTQVGALAGVERTLPGHGQLELGVRHVQQGTQPAAPATAAAAPGESTSLRTKLTMPMPYVAKLQAFGEYEQDVADVNKRILAVGATYQVLAHGKIYARHELISSLGSEFSLNNQQQQAATVVGIDTDYLKNSHLFSEFRGHDAFSGRETEAAIGLRNGYTLRPGLRLNTTLESVKVLKGSDLTDAVALTGGLEYTANPLWKGSARLEWRGASNSQSYLNTLGAAIKLSNDWTMLARNVFNLTTTTSGPENNQQRDRMQLGFAYRQSSASVWNALAMVEYKDERAATSTDVTDRRVAVVSTNFNVQPTKRLVLTSRYATRFTIDNSSGVSSDTADHLLSGRATYDIKEKWDVGMQLMTGLSRGLSTCTYGLGWELGRLVAKNLWVSAGYNVLGFRDVDLAAENETNRGGYIRLRFKFDERLFQKGGKPPL